MTLFKQYKLNSIPTFSDFFSTEWDAYTGAKAGLAREYKCNLCFPPKKSILCLSIFCIKV